MNLGSEQACNYSECNSPADVARQLAAPAEGATWYYCKAHDPLDDPEVAQHWEAADES